MYCELDGPAATLMMLQRDFLASTMRTSALRKRAAQLVGADDKQMEEADDADDVRSLRACLLQLHRLTVICAPLDCNSCAA